MASVTFSSVGKVYPDGHRAVENLDLHVEDGEFMVFVGPSGCGKTTALRMVAGLEEISEGEIKIGDEVVNLLDPRKRDVAMVFQNYALYPHMSVFDNVAFPLRSRRMPSSEVRERVEKTAALLGLTDMLDRRPRTLSGGQRQRVAMGRAIVREPRVFLMDEPLSNLDAKLRVQMRAEISQLQEKLAATTIYVTHDQVEALTMGNRIAVMRKGLLQQTGPPQDLYDRPVNLFVATFIGAPAMNLFSARLEPQGDGLACVVGDQRLLVPRELVTSRPGIRAYRGRKVAVGIRPEHLTDAAYAQEALLTLEGEVVLVEALGSERLVHVGMRADPVLTDEVMEIAQDTDAAVAQTLQAEAAEHHLVIIARFDTRSDLKRGDVARVAADPRHLHFFDLESGLALY
jgi:multiple sugar transport system ATP-binding protein